MKNTIIVVMLVVACLTCQFCDKKGPLTKTDVEKLLGRIGGNSMGLKIEGHPDGFITSAAEDGFSRIVLKDATFNFDPTVFYRALDPKLDLKETVLALPCGEVELAYHPGKDRLKLVAIRDLDADWNMLDMFGPSLWKQTASSPDPSKMRLRMKAGEITFWDHDISALIGKDPLPLWPLITQLLSDNPVSETKMNGVEAVMELSGIKGQDTVEDFQFTFTTDWVRGKQALAAELITLFSPDGEKPVDLSTILKGGAPLFDLTFEMGNSRLQMGKAGASAWQAQTESASIAYSLKPAQEDRYGFELAWGVTGLKTSIPEDPDLERLLNLDRFDFEISLGRLSESFLVSYFDLIRKTQSLRASPQSQEQIQAVSAMGMQIAGAFFSSQPRLEATLLLDHHYGKLTGESSFQFAQMAQPPIGYAKATLFDIGGIEAKMAAGSGLGEKQVKEIFERIKSVFSPDGEGNGRMMFEIKKETPWSYTLNGKTVPFLSNSWPKE